MISWSKMNPAVRKHEDVIKRDVKLDNNGEDE
jgi:hypothetical protein